MKCLIITREVGIGAAGLVFKRIIDELSNTHQISLISRRNEVSWNNGQVYSLPSSTYIPSYRASKLSDLVFGYNIFEYLWMLQQSFKNRQRQMNEYDIVMSFVCGTSYMELLFARCLAKKNNIKWMVYSVDALPTPNSWQKINNRKKRSAIINKCLKDSDALFFSNQQMLDYQLQMLDGYHGKPNVLHTPITHNIQLNNGLRDGKKVFLYTGTIYGPRRINALLDAFRLFISDTRYNDASLIFVGIQNNSIFEPYYDLIESRNVEIYPFSDKLSDYYNNASVLIDINSYLDNDLFLSSKLVNYLPLNKPIISISGNNSPSRNIFTEDISIIHCLSDTEEIKQAMYDAVKLCVNPNERSRYIEQFKLERLVHSLEQVMLTITE